jgi:hypothetical protein
MPDRAPFLTLDWPFFLSFPRLLLTFRPAAIIRCAALGISSSHCRMKASCDEPLRASALIVSRKECEKNEGPLGSKVSLLSRGGVIWPCSKRRLGWVRVGGASVVFTWTSALQSHNGGSGRGGKEWWQQRLSSLMSLTGARRMQTASISILRTMPGINRGTRKWVYQCWSPINRMILLDWTSGNKIDRAQEVDRSTAE